MPALAGRDFRIKYSSDGGTTYTAVAGSTQDNFTINTEGIDITDKDDSGVRTFLAGAGNKGTWNMEGGIEGVLKDSTLLAEVADPTSDFLLDFQFELAGIGTFEGTFGISSYNPTGPAGAEAVTFSATLMSSGTPTFTPA